MYIFTPFNQLNQNNMTKKIRMTEKHEAIINVLLNAISTDAPKTAQEAALLKEFRQFSKDAKHGKPDTH